MSKASWRPDSARRSARRVMISGVTGPWGSQPSPRWAARRIAAGEEPPTQMGGPSSWIGRGVLAQVGGRPAGTGKRRVVLGEGGAQGVDGLVEQPAPLGEGQVEQVELALHVAGADPHDDPPARHHVEGGEGLGHLERVAVGGDVDVAEEADVVGDASQPAQGGDGVPPLGAHGVGLLGGDGDVVTHPHVGEAGVVGGPGDGGQLVGPGTGLPRLGVDRGLRLDRELHAHRQPTLGEHTSHG